MMVKGEGKHTRVSHLNRRRNKRMRNEDMKQILFTNHREQKSLE